MRFRYLMFFALALLMSAPVVGQNKLLMKPETIDREMGCTNELFPCRHDVDQTYQLPESPFTSQLLTVAEIRSLYQPRRRQPTIRRVARSLRDEIQQVGYVQENEESEPDTASEKNEDSLSAFATVNGGTVYSSMNPEELSESLRDLKEAISSDSQLNSATRAARLQILSSANDAILKIQKAIGQQQRFEQQVAKDRDQQGLKSQLEQVIEPEHPDVENKTIEQLMAELTARQSELEINKQELTKLEAQIQMHLERVSQIPQDRAKTKANLEEIRDQIANRHVQTDDMDNQLSLILLELKYRSAEAELAKLDSEEERQVLGASIDPIHRDLKSREVKRLEEEVSRWELAVKSLRRTAVREEQREAIKDTDTAHPILRPLAEQNELLVSERRELVEQLSALRTERTDVQRETEAIVERRREIENKIEAAGLTATNGMLLVDLRRNLSSTGESHIRIRRLQTELRRVNLKKVGLNEDRDELSDPISMVGKLVDMEQPDNPLIPIAIELVKKKRDYVDQLLVEYQSYGREVSEVSQARKKLIDEINETVTYIDENALWIRSAEPIGIADLHDVKEGIDQFFSSERWTDLACMTQQRAIARPYESAMATLFLTGILVVNRRVKRKLDPGIERDE